MSTPPTACAQSETAISTLQLQKVPVTNPKLDESFIEKQQKRLQQLIAMQAAHNLKQFQQYCEQLGAGGQAATSPCGNPGRIGGSERKGKTTVSGDGHEEKSGQQQPSFKSPFPIVHPVPIEQLNHFMELHVTVNAFGVERLQSEDREKYVKFRNDWLVSWHNFPPAQKALYHRAHMAAANEGRRNDQRDWGLEPTKKRAKTTSPRDSVTK